MVIAGDKINSIVPAIFSAGTIMHGRDADVRASSFFPLSALRCFFSPVALVESSHFCAREREREEEER